jgi:hypothetical protein
MKGEGREGGEGEKIIKIIYLPLKSSMPLNKQRVLNPSLITSHLSNMLFRNQGQAFMNSLLLNLNDTI